jgi:capsular polysaccharide transport system permease protein
MTQDNAAQSSAARVSSDQVVDHHKKQASDVESKHDIMSADEGEDAAGPVDDKTFTPTVRQKQSKRIKLLQRKVRQTERALAEMEVQMAEMPTFPVARQAHMRRRHWGLIASFVALVIAPLAFVIFYLITFAEDQYASTTGFTVRSQDANASSDILGGLASFTGTSVASDSDILYEFIQSQEMVTAVNAVVPLREHFGQNWPHDWFYGIWPDATLEELVWYWHRVVKVSFDSSSGLIEVQAVAFDSETAQAITRAIVSVSQTRINALNDQAREDAMSYARADLNDTIEKLKVAREALAEFRTRTRIVNPAADIQGRMGVMSNLQTQLAEALIEFDILRASVAANDPRLTQAEQKIVVIRDRIDIERQTFASSNTDTGAVGQDYPSLISEYERLAVDQEFAEQTYRAALAALEVARAEATRQSRYLATYINPTLAQESEYPRRILTAALAGLFLVLSWSIGALIYYSIRDRS